MKKGLFRLLSVLTLFLCISSMQISSIVYASTTSSKQTNNLIANNTAKLIINQKNSDKSKQSSDFINESKSNILFNYVEITGKKLNDDTGRIFLLNNGIDSVDSVSMVFRAYRNGVLQLTRTKLETDLMPYISRKVDFSCPNFDYITVTAIATDGGDSSEPVTIKIEG